MNADDPSLSSGAAPVPGAASPQWFMYVLRSRACETSSGGEVHHANYLSWFESARTDMTRRLGMTYRSLEERGLRLPIVEVVLRCHRVARCDERIAIFTRVSEASLVRVRFESEIRRLSETAAGTTEHARCDGTSDWVQGEVLASGMTRCVWLDTTWRPVRIDRDAPDLHRLLRSLCDGAQAGDERRCG